MDRQEIKNSAEAFMVAMDTVKDAIRTSRTPMPALADALGLELGDISRITGKQLPTPRHMDRIAARLADWGNNDAERAERIAELAARYATLGNAERAELAKLTATASASADIDEDTKAEIEHAADIWQQHEAKLYHAVASFTGTNSEARRVFGFNIAPKLDGNQRITYRNCQCVVDAFHEWQTLNDTRKPFVLLSPEEWREQQDRHGFEVSRGGYEHYVKSTREFHDAERWNAEQIEAAAPELARRKEAAMFRKMRPDEVRAWCRENRPDIAV